MKADDSITLDSPSRQPHGMSRDRGRPRLRAMLLGLVCAAGVFGALTLLYHFG